MKSKDEKRSERIAEALLDNQTVEILKTEDTGLIETEGMEKSSFLTQERIAKEVDMNTRQKMYSLTLDQFGPYKVYFDRPGRHLLLSGEKGHLAMVLFVFVYKSRWMLCVRIWSVSSMWTIVFLMDVSFMTGICSQQLKTNIFTSMIVKESSYTVCVRFVRRVPFSSCLTIIYWFLVVRQVFCPTWMCPWDRL